MSTTATCWLAVCVSWAGTCAALADAVDRVAAGAARDTGRAVLGDLNVPIEAPAGNVLTSTPRQVATSGAVSSWAFVLLDPGATMPQDHRIAAPVQAGWPTTDGLTALTVYVRSPGSRDAPPPRLITQAPFPTGMGMGLVGLALALGVAGVRRYRLSIV